MSDYQFFATPGDLIPGWDAVKNIIDFKFVKEGFRDNPDWPIYRSLIDIPNLGIAHSGRVRGGDAYIIMPHTEPVHITKYHNGPDNWTVQNFKTEYYYSVTFIPEYKHFAYFSLGGYWMEQDVPNLIGHKLFFGVGELSPNNEFLNQFKLLGKSLIKGFNTVKMKPFGQWKVGPEALEMYRNGVRLIPYRADLQYSTIIPQFIVKKTKDNAS